MKILAGMVVSLVAGTTIGSIAGLMFAPVEGKKTRKELMDRWKNIKADLDSACDKAKEAVTFFNQKAKEQAGKEKLA